jgi:chaperonin GroES
MKFKPLGERALVRIVEREETTASGIVLPDTAKEKPQTAEVVAVGQFEDGIQVSEGDVIVFAKYSGTEINLEGADDILGIVEN